ncbi:site-specific DNA-methyltransferase, partial [Proteiniphilum sp. UBA1028]
VLQKSYFGKVKMIYIDPPYNTGNDSFIYPDRFSETKEEYQKRVGDKDDEGYMTSEGMFRRNSRENGQYHSNWLNMMMPRLYLAKNLLQEDGVIFISIDDNEVHNLRLLMNEIFGEENFVGELIWKSRQNKDNRNITGLSIDHEYVLCYSKYNDGRKLNGSERKTEQYANPDNDSRGDWVSGNMVGLLGEDLRPNCHYDLINPETGINYGKPKLGWRYDKKTMSRLIEEKRIIWPDSKDGRPRRKVFLNELNSELPNFTSIIGEKTYTRDGTKEIDELFNSKYFDFPKPTTLIGELIKQGTDCRGNDIILDFFAGSATTAHAVMQLNKDGGNRKYICVQMPEPCEEKSEAYKAGYNTIADIAKERIRRAGKKIQSEIAEENRKNKEKLDFDKSNEEIKLDTGFKVFKLSVSNFKQWRQSPLHNSEELTDQLKLFIDPIAENAIIEDMVYELLLKSGKDLNSRVENNDGYYLIDSNELAFILEKVNEQIILEVLSEYPKKVIALDRIFNENDQLKTNTALQMKDAGVEFKTI